MNQRTAALMLSSFYAASKTATCGSMPMNAATAAGQFLHLFGGPKAALAAIRAMPPDPIWTRAAGYLEEIVASTAPDTLPPGAIGGM